MMLKIIFALSTSMLFKIVQLYLERFLKTKIQHMCAVSFKGESGADGIVTGLLPR